jgi:hypothetical protein
MRPSWHVLACQLTLDPGKVVRERTLVKKHFFSKNFDFRSVFGALEV